MEVKLTPKVYADWVYNVAAGPSKVAVSPWMDKCLLASIGLPGEVGEVLEILKAYIFHGKGFQRDDLIAELGDVFWYFCLLSKSFEIHLDEILAASEADREDVTLVMESAWMDKALLGTIGLPTAVGPVLELIKKCAFHHKAFMREDLVKNLAVVMWNFNLISQSFNITLDEIMEANVDKLIRRRGHPDPRQTGEIS
jgi:NTP pyrophosphatase (non-canonical NTP hydrolase)